MTHRTFNESGRAVGFVNYDVRSTRDTKKPCVIFLQQLGESFARPSAILVVKGIADPNFSATICNVPPHVNQLFIQQVHMSTTADFVAFTASADANNPNSRSGVPMIFKRIPTKNNASKNTNNSGGAVGSPSRNNNNGDNEKITTASYDLEACDHFIKQEDDLNGDTLQTVYFPQYVSVGDAGTTHIVCVCRAENGTRTCYTIKLQGATAGGFSLFSNLFKRTRKIAGATSRHVPGTDIIMMCQQKMSDNININLAVRHYSLHTITNSGNFERIYEVSIAPEVSRAWPGETLMNGFLFWEGSSKDEYKLQRELSLGATQASSSNNYHLPRISSFVVAYIKFDFPVRAEDCGATTEKEFVNRHVVRLFVFRPRNKHNGYQGSDWYIDLYFSKKNIAIFQISSLGQMCIMSPGYKAYFVDVKYFGHDLGPSVSVVQYLDKESVAQQTKITGAALAAQHIFQQQQNQQQRLSPSATGPVVNNNSTATTTTPSQMDPRAIPIPTKNPSYLDADGKQLSGSAMMAATSSSLRMMMKNNTNNANNEPATNNNNSNPHASSAFDIDHLSSPHSNTNNSNQASPTSAPSSSTLPPNSATLADNNKKRNSSGLSSNSETFLEECCFLGEKFPDCFLRPNCIPSKLSPIEINAEQGKFVVFFSTHVSAVLFFENRKPMWQSAQFSSLLRDKYRKRVIGSERNHDGEHAARGVLSVMDRVALSLVSRATITGGGTAASPSTSNNSGKYHHHPHNNNCNNNNNAGAVALASFGAASCMPNLLSGMNSRDLVNNHLIFGNSILTDKLEIDDTLTAFNTIIPVFQQMGTQLRDPVAICMEWIIAAAYLRLGTRCQSCPPRLTFDFSHYEGLIHPVTLPRTTAHARLRGFPMRTALITGGIETNGLYGRMISVQPRDPFVKALELRIEDVQYRDDLIKGFKKFVAYEECLLEHLFPEIFRKVKENLEPSPLSRYGRGAMNLNLNNTSPGHQQLGRPNSSGGGGGSVNASQSKICSKPNFPSHPMAVINSSITPVVSAGMHDGADHLSNNQHQQGTPISSGIKTSPELYVVNQFCFLLDRLTALDILGVRVEEKAPVFTSCLIYAAANDDLLPFNALARAIWQRNISNQLLDGCSILLNPLSRFANRENERLSVRVTANSNRISSTSSRGTFFSQQRIRQHQMEQEASDAKRKQDMEKEKNHNSNNNNDNNNNELIIPPLRSFASNSECRFFYPSFDPSLLTVGKPFEGVAIPSLLSMTSRTCEENLMLSFASSSSENGLSTSKKYLEMLRDQF